MRRRYRFVGVRGEAGESPDLRGSRENAGSLFAARLILRQLGAVWPDAVSRERLSPPWLSHGRAPMLAADALWPQRRRRSKHRPKRGSLAGVPRMSGLAGAMES